MDLRVMSPTSYQTALPRVALTQYNDKSLKFQPDSINYRFLGGAEAPGEGQETWPLPEGQETWPLPEGSSQD